MKLFRYRSTKDAPRASRRVSLLVGHCVTLLALVAGGMHLPASAAESVAAALDQALAASHRSAANRARDSYRNPKQTLLFFGIRPDMQVIEVWPGAGWYTEVLAPLLREQGRYIAAHYHVTDDTHRFYRTSQARFVEKLKGQPSVYDRVTVTGLLPPHVDMVPPGSVDLVLTFRNVHNWTAEGYDDVMFKAFHAALKPGGILGVVEHRAKEGTTLAEMIRSGYMTEAYVIRLAERAGFKLGERAEINANPKDSKDHPKGVWTLPPTLRLGEEDRGKYLAIGESDRMTLKFIKP